MQGQAKPPSWITAADDDDEDEGTVVVDEIKLANLIKRRKTYCDITQNATESQLRRLLKTHRNDIPQVIEELELWVRTKGSYTVIPPGFYERDGTFRQPPSFEMPLIQIQMNDGIENRANKEKSL